MTLFDPWIYKMAWRDSRGSRRQLVLFLSSMVVGVAALVAISSFGNNLREAVDQESKSLLGADLVLERDGTFPAESEILIDSIGGVQSRRVSFNSMAYFPSTGDTRLSTVRAIEGGYPFYGEVVTTPAAAAYHYLERRGALVDATLMTQFGVQLGDSVRIGRRGYAILGRLEKTPRENEIMSLFSPRIYIPRDGLDTLLLTEGSRAEYDVNFFFDDARDVEALVDDIRPRLREHKIDSDTVEETREDWDESLTNLYRFLSIVAFMALLLGGIGVASAINIYVRKRKETIAVLRCVGAKATRTFAIYAVQAAVMGLAGGLIGAAIGVAIQAVVPFVLKELLPVGVSFAVSWSSVLLGIIIGLSVTVLFAMLPLVAIRKISPLLTLRSAIEAQSPMKDIAWWAVLGFIALGMLVFAVANAPEPLYGFGYSVGLGVVFVALLVVARGIMWLTRRFFPTSWAYVWRQGLANLFRPNNQTSTLMLSLGLGTFLIATLFGVQATLLSQIEVAGGEGRPNIVFFDIQPGEIEGVTNIVEAQGLPVVDRVPIVTMRLSEVNGRTIEELRADSTVDLRWVHRREYRSTYRNYLTESEEVVEGEFVGGVEEGAEVVPISVEEDIAGELDVGIGDTLVFDVQGRAVKTLVGSLRAVDWRRIATNFFVVFPDGVLEEAPQFFVLMSRAETTEEAATVQREIVRTYPSVSSIDLTLVLSTFDAIFGRISFIVRFMASFSIITGLIVLVGAVVVSRMERVRESVLLKTLGASRRQVMQIMITEYLFLGFFAAATGLMLSVFGAWALSYFLFETAFHPDVVAMLALLVVVPGLTVGIGMISSRGIYSRTPLESLRADV
jgi:putative ABC transport system permease protein